MTNYTIALIAAFLGAALAALSQYLLKLSAQKKYENKIREYLNMYVILAYFILFLITIINLYALRYLPLSLLPLIETTSYIHVALIAYFLLDEKISRQKLLGLTLIIIGVLIANI